MRGGTSTLRLAALLIAGAAVPGAGHLLAGFRRAGLTLLALSVVVLLPTLALAVRLVGAPLEAAQLVAATGGLALAGVVAMAWLLVVAAATADLLRRLTPSRRAGARTGSRRGSAVAAVIVLVPALACSLVAASAFTGRGILESIVTGAGSGSLQAQDGRYNLLLVGADRAPGRTAVMPDSISVVSVEAAGGRASVIGIDRTTQNFDFPAGSALASVFPEGNRCSTGCALNHAYPYGLAHADLWPGSADPGMAALTEAVEGFTGLRMSGYVYVELDAFVRLIDALGGVTVDVGTEVPRVGVPDEGADALTVVGPPIEPGLQRMDGETALWFARSRYASSNSERMVRQGCLEDALLSQVDPADVLAAVLSLAATTDGIRTDVGPDGLALLAALAERARQLPLARVDLGHPLVEPLQPDPEVVAAAIAEVLDGVPEGAVTGPPDGEPDGAVEPPGPSMSAGPDAPILPPSSPSDPGPVCSIP